MGLFTELQLSRISHLVTDKFRSGLVFPIGTWTSQTFVMTELFQWKRKGVSTKDFGLFFANLPISEKSLYLCVCMSRNSKKPEMSHYLISYITEEIVRAKGKIFSPITCRWTQVPTYNLIWDRTVLDPLTTACRVVHWPSLFSLFYCHVASDGLNSFICSLLPCPIVLQGLQVWVADKTKETNKQKIGWHNTILFSSNVYFGTKKMFLSSESKTKIITFSSMSGSFRDN